MENVEADIRINKVKKIIGTHLYDQGLSENLRSSMFYIYNDINRETAIS